MSVEEKISQLGHDSPAIPRLGIPAFNWWNEALHGVARAGRATVYPQAIGLAATWDPSLVQRIARSIANEARAKGLGGRTFFAPNINLFRDPRWGRGQETYGEDPLLTGTLAAAFIRGLQDQNRAAAVVKHFAVHSGPERLRHDFDATPSERDLRESYLPQFHMAVEAGVAGVMCAYNRVLGEPACASEFLLGQTLRDEWNFQGFVVSDCWAISDIQAESPAAAAAMALKAGTDLACGPEFQEHLLDALHQGLITEADIDRALERLQRVRARLAEGSDAVPLADGKLLAREAAQQSMVLLRNRGNLLPLDRAKIRKLAVIGPNADDESVLYGNYNGYPLTPGVTPFAGLRDAGVEEVRYTQGSDLAEGVPVLETLQIDEQWRDLAEPFHREWTVEILAPFTGDYAIGAEAQGKFELFLDGEFVVGGYNITERGLHDETVHLEQGRRYTLRIAFDAEGRGNDASIRLAWSTPDPQRLEKALDLAQWADAVVLCLGLSTRLEDEDRDRETLALPAPQQQLLERILATGKPVIVVLLSGSALTWGNADPPAILQAWYPGQEGGAALAEVLFGDAEPGGRLPITFYRSDDDLPDFRDYSMAGRTYRYFAGEPLFRFGHGLGYTTFRREPVSEDEVRVTNTGSRRGSDVVQRYSTVDGSLTGFARVTLEPGESRVVRVDVPSKSKP